MRLFSSLPQSLAANVVAGVVLLVVFCGAAPKPKQAHPAPHPTPTQNPVYGRLHWREVGPAAGGGRVAAVAGTASDPFLYYIGAAGGGVWKSSDGGTTWDPVFDKQSVASIGAVAIDPKDKKTVWVGTGEANPRNDVSYGNGVYKSTDGGDTWRDVGVQGARNIARVAVNPKDTKTVLVAAFGDFYADNPNGGVWRTADGGRTWQHTLYVGPQSGASDVVIDPSDPRVVFAGVWQVRREPWMLTSGGPAGGLYRSSDGGRTWTKLTGHGLPSGLTGRIALGIAPSDTRRVYALIQSKAGVLWRSKDGGNTWQLATDNPIADVRPFYFSQIAVDPKNPNHLFSASLPLTESTNGGKTFKPIADEVHVDYHAIWIDPSNAKRMMVGEDGGYALSVNGGKTWSFSKNLAIAQVYHTAFDDRNPYWVCAPLQDNNSFCGPSNGLSPDGIINDAWRRLGGGDGMWAVPDPADPNRVWYDDQTGFVSIFDLTTGYARLIRPVFNLSTADFTLYAQKYRFNWDSPIAVAPWDPHTWWLGANVIFQTSDDGAHWSVISPDLTRNIKAHQQASGGPISLDVSSAEFSDNTLDIEGSPLAKGEIWVGTDDGLVQLTRDGGLHWNDVTPQGAPQFGRVETVAPSPFADGTAYAIFDVHKSGDYRPYIYATSDFGRTWRKITAGLPADQYVRTVRPDIRNAAVLYAGTEQGMWISYDDGRSWQSLQLNLPPASVRDIRIQPTFGDIVIATHGRALWILDDARPVQELRAAQAAGVYFFPLRTAYQYHEHSNIEDLYENYAAANPPPGVIINFWQSQPRKQPPPIEILDAQGHVVRTISGTHKVEGKETPFVTDDRGLNRAVWGFEENGPVRWMGAAREESRGPYQGAVLPPGMYTVRLKLDGREMSQTVEVKPDPRLTLTQADYQAKYEFNHKYFTEYSNINVALNALDATKKGIDGAMPALEKGGTKTATALAQALAIMRARDALFARLTINAKSDEASVAQPGALREEVEGLLDTGSPPTPPLLAVGAQIDDLYNAAMHSYDSFASSVGELNRTLVAAGMKAIPQPPAITRSLGPETRLPL
ncbi:MAG: hypothetical protein JOZ50_05670 [Candidatus Eremiobacteraeota bacterium]|nr:hypothetical protein [Candidatus Eremiobacteraeota bacterium]